MMLNKRIEPIFVAFHSLPAVVDSRAGIRCELHSAPCRPGVAGVGYERYIFYSFLRTPAGR